MSAKDLKLDAHLDTQLELKKRARRRLVGAIALAVLAAIVVPMVMDQEPKPATQDIQIRIPNQDAGSFTSRILPVKPGVTATPLPAPPPEAKPAEVAKPVEAAKPAAVAKPAAEIKTAADSKPVSIKVDKPVDKPGDKPVEMAAEKAIDKAPAKPADHPAAKIDAKAEQAKLEAALTGAAAEQWVVQLGAYRDAANVRTLQTKLKAQGYNFYTEALDAPDGSKKTRVRAGPFPSKEAAEKARERIKRIGVDGVVAQK